MTVMAVLAVLVALAAPSFTPMLERWRMRQSAEALQASLHYARSEALKRGGRVAIRKNDDSMACSTGSSGEWNCGWTVFVDTNENGIMDSGEELLRSIPAPAQTRITPRPIKDFVTFNRWGLLGHGLEFALVPLVSSSTSAKAALKVCFGVGGLVQRVDFSSSC